MSPQTPSAQELITARAVLSRPSLIRRKLSLGLPKLPVDGYALPCNLRSVADCAFASDVLDFQFMAQSKPINRCPWPPLDDPLYVAYHDKEWGVPVHDDRKLFEFLILEVFQAGLSWRTVLHKRENFRAAFAKFDYRRVARFTAKDIKRLVADAGIIRNQAKIKAAVNNAQRLLEVRAEFGTFAKYMWGWVEGRPVVNRFRAMKECRLSTMSPRGGQKI